MKPGVLWDRLEGACVCVCVRICELLFRLRFGQIWNFGIWAADQEFASWGVSEREFGEWRMAVQGARGGVRMGCPSLLPLLSSFCLAFSLSLPLHVFSGSSCWSPHSLSQGHTGRSLNDHFPGQPQLIEVTPVRGRLRHKTREKKFIYTTSRLLCTLQHLQGTATCLTAVCVCVCLCVHVLLVFLSCLPPISMQGACVSNLYVCICVSVLLHSAISQPPTESDTYTVRMDESLSPSFSFPLLLSYFLYIFCFTTYHTCQLILPFFCVEVLASDAFVSVFLTSSPSCLIFQEFIVIISVHVSKGFSFPMHLAEYFIFLG
uniref:uncharacterized protein LOC109954775 n=1 Tax=Monopterus albus TaxID=43700 RepID=UPI0009B3DE8E|nr:uncharacterized protein LOC109954775 [Monopterus albus]